MPFYAPKSARQPPADELTIPEFSSGRILPLDQVESVILRQIADHWASLRGTRKFPARSDLQPRDLKRLLRHVTLLRVLDNGADYEYRVMGDVQVQAFGETFSGLRLSEVAKKHPKFAEGLRLLYDGARMGGEAFSYRGWIGRDMPDTKYSYHEIAYFPFGATDEAVDHILVAGVYVGRGGFHIG